MDSLDQTLAMQLCTHEHPKEDWDAICENFERDQHEYVTEMKHEFDSPPAPTTISGLEDAATCELLTSTRIHM